MMNGLDWKTVGWVEYQQALAGWNAAHDVNAKPEIDPEGSQRLKRAMSAQMTQ